VVSVEIGVETRGHERLARLVDQWNRRLLLGGCRHDTRSVSRLENTLRLEAQRAPPIIGL
jgi:hypothetical protein